MVGGFCVDTVIALVKPKVIVAFTRVKGSAVIARQMIVTVTAVQHTVAAAGEEFVVSVATVQVILLGRGVEPGIEAVIAIVAIDDVISSATDYCVVAVAASGVPKAAAQAYEIVAFATKGF